MLNKIFLMGRLTKNPELRTTQSGVSVCSFTIAVDRDFSGKGEEKQTDFFECTAWRSTADFISKYFSKGRMIIVDGSLQSRKWQDKEGNSRVSWEVLANNIYFGDNKRSDNGQQNEAPAANFADVAEDDGELPF